MILAAMMLAQAAVAQPSAQAMFDAASAAAEAERWAEALAGYEALERRYEGKSPRTVAIVRVRKGDVLLQLERRDEARDALVSGLAALPADDASLLADRVDAQISLARLALNEVDYPRARAYYETLRPLATSTSEKLRVETGLAIATMFESPAQSLTHADAAMALVAATPGTPKALRAQVRTLRGRALLNAKDYKAAQKELELAMRELGGLTTKVDLADISARSDLAIAAMLAGKPDAAREYLAFTGAGTMKAPLASATYFAPPPCGGDAELKPEDVAIIQFAIGADGKVIGVTPIYASRGAVASTFARGVRDWSWSPEGLAKITPLFRVFNRVELRCSTAAARPPVYALLKDATDAWFQAKGVAPVEGGQDFPALLAAARTQMAAADAAGRDALALYPALMAYATSPLTDRTTSRAAARRAAALLAAEGAPGSVQAWYHLGMGWVLDVRPTEEDARLRAALASPAVQADAQAAAALKLKIADGFLRRPPADARTLLMQVADDARLAERDQLRIGAYVRLANVQAQTGDVAAARASYAKTGLDAQQCALVDARPRMTQSGASSSDFPREAMRWGFEGWVRTEFDISADGKTLAQRAVVAYPPFVFNDAAVGLAKGMQFTQSYRPEGALGCGGQAQTIRFGLPSK